MGWTFTRNATKQDVIDELVASLGSDIVDVRVCGRVLWFVWRAPGAGVIGCWLLEPDAEFGWGYKDFEERMEPYYYNCPPEFLDLAPVACQRWRQGVIAYSEAGRPEEDFRL